MEHLATKPCSRIIQLLCNYLCSSYYRILKEQGPNNSQWLTSRLVNLSVARWLVVTKVSNKFRVMLTDNLKFKCKLSWCSRELEDMDRDFRSKLKQVHLTSRLLFSNSKCKHKCSKWTRIIQPAISTNRRWVGQTLRWFKTCKVVVHS